MLLTVWRVIASTAMLLTPFAAQSQAAAPGLALPAVPTTKVLAIGNIVAAPNAGARGCRHHAA